MRRNYNDDPVIIKRRIKRVHATEPSGAWKVAFADFALVMMTLFMVLWVIQPQADAERLEQLVHTDSAVPGGGLGVFDGVSRVPADFGATHERVEPQVRRDKSSASTGEGETAERYDSQAELQALATLMNLLAERIDATANLEVHVVPQGLRILIKDDDTHFMFERGSASLNPRFRTLLTALAKELLKVDNKLIISGHTDSTPYRGARGYDNWNLSGERALQARGVLIGAGLPAHGVLQVSAQADVMPLQPKDPQSGVNRRIELLLLTGQAEAVYRQLFSASYAYYAPNEVDYIESAKSPAKSL